MSRIKSIGIAVVIVLVAIILVILIPFIIAIGSFLFAVVCISFLIVGVYQVSKDEVHIPIEKDKDT